MIVPGIGVSPNKNALHLDLEKTRSENKSVYKAIIGLQKK